MARPRVFISHDGRLGAAEKDDWQSLIHALMYQDRMDIQGIAATGSRWGGGQKISDTHSILNTYGQDLADLQAHASGFKSVATLKAASYQGKTTTQPWAGYSTPTAASNAIIKEAKEAAAAGTDLNVLVWGGAGDIAQALHDAPSIADDVRLFTVYDQDQYATRYIKANFQDDLAMWVHQMSTFRGIYQSPTSTNIIQGWHQENADNHGALGDRFAALSVNLHGKTGVKMGDSATVFRFLKGDQNNPGAESWGGEYRKTGVGNYWTDKTDDALDFNRSGTDGAMTIYEDRRAWLDSFESRFDWLL